MDDQLTWRYVSRGKVKHALKPSADAFLFGVSSYCGIRPYTATLWLGKMSYEQRVRLGRMERCSHCLRKIKDQGALSER